MKYPILENVAQHHSPAFIGGGRRGTVQISLAEMRELFGEPTDTGDGDKVTAEWYFSTPAGLVEVRDYWWNSDDEMSIGASNRNSAMWVAAYFRARGYPASLYTKLRGPHGGMDQTNWKLRSK